MGADSRFWQLTPCFAPDLPGDRLLSESKERSNHTPITVSA